MCELFSNPEMIQLQARIFDDVRPSNARLFLLKRSGDATNHASGLSSVMEIISGWNVIFDREFRDSMKVSIATETDLSDAVAQSSFVGYGLGDAGDEIDVFPYEGKDAVKPNATSPSWKIHATRDGKERFLIP